MIYQPNYNSRYYSGPNPYALGFAIFRDIKRICEGGEFKETSKGRVWVPITEEDRQWFPKLVGTRWQDAVKHAAFEHRDDSFIQQYLSPKVIRDLRLFTVNVKYDSTEEDANPLAASAIVTDSPCPLKGACELRATDRG